HHLRLFPTESISRPPRHLDAVTNPIPVHQLAQSLAGQRRWVAHTSRFFAMCASRDDRPLDAHMANTAMYAPPNPFARPIRDGSTIGQVVDSKPHSGFVPDPSPQPATLRKSFALPSLQSSFAPCCRRVR